MESWLIILIIIIIILVALFVWFFVLGNTSLLRSPCNVSDEFWANYQAKSSFVSLYLGRKVFFYKDGTVQRHWVLLASGLPEENNRLVLVTQYDKTGIERVIREYNTGILSLDCEGGVL